MPQAEVGIPIGPQQVDFALIHCMHGVRELQGVHSGIPQRTDKHFSGAFHQGVSGGIFACNDRTIHEG